MPDSAPREGRGELVKPEVLYGSRGAYIPTGTRARPTERDLPLRYEPIRNGVQFVAYDPSPAARKARAPSPRYAHARVALERAAARYGPRPMTIRGLKPRKPRTPATT